jgi:branched-chain amino acid transport system substrate-binding protein
MKLAGTATDGVKIRAQMDKAFKSLPPENNPQEIEGLDEKGGTIANVLMGVVEGGKIKDTSLRAANAAK